jgi:hypothetical protein
MKRRTEITIEIDRVMIISRQSNQLYRCEACRAEVSMMLAEEAAIFAGATTQAIYRMAQTGVIHSRLMTDGTLLICRASLVRTQDPEQVIETSMVLVEKGEHRAG